MYTYTNIIPTNVNKHVTLFVSLSSTLGLGLGLGLRLRFRAQLFQRIMRTSAHATSEQRTTLCISSIIRFLRFLLKVSLESLSLFFFLKQHMQCFIFLHRYLGCLVVLNLQQQMIKIIKVHNEALKPISIFSNLED